MKGGLGEIDQRGAGVFGHWSEDADGRPVYVYTMDHARDPRALYNTSLGPSRDHWHQVGTGEFVATVHNGGYAQIYDWSRGGKCLNRWDPDNGHFGGGFLLVEIDGEAFSTLWEGLPEGAVQERRWGCNYAERITRWRDVEIFERLSPDGLGNLAQRWRVTNRGRLPVSVRVTAPWWINIHAITPAPLMTHGLRKLIDKKRSRLRNWHVLLAQMTEFGALGSTVRMLTAFVLKSRPVPYRPLRGGAVSLGHSPCLQEESCGLSPCMVAMPMHAVARGPRTGLPCSIERQHLQFHQRGNCGSMRIGEAWRDTEFEPRAMNYELGIYPANEVMVLAALYELEIPADETREDAIAISISNGAPDAIYPDKMPEIDLCVPRSPALSRETRWHSAYLQGGAQVSGYHGTRFVDQGSTYSYLQGLSGAPRDFALFILPMVYLNPPLAKDMLRHLFSCQHHRTGKLPYANVNNGRQRGYVLHSFSSDLDLFLLWAAAEYLGATRDLGFLKEPVRYFPRGKHKKAKVLDHLQKAFAHLRDRVGLGPHGLIRCGSGDWNDVLLGFSRVPPLTFLRGESSLNAGLAALALPRLADALGDTAPEFAAELRAYGEAQAVALKTLWTGRWAARGYLGYGNKKLGEDRIFLDTQALGVLAGVWDEAQRATLFENIDELCVRPQKVGALALWPPMKGPLLVEGSDTNGGTWAAIDGLLAWAWAQHDPQRAWEFYQSTTLAARADAYPDTWYGVWSGPDSFNAHYHARPGETFCHNFTPMTDFPIMNMNRHALPLLDAVKFAGIEPRDGVIEIRPRVPGGIFSFRSKLIDVSSDGTTISCEYRPVCDGSFCFRVAVPGALGGEAVRGRLNAESIDVVCDAAGMISLCDSTNVGRVISWQVAVAN